MDYSAGKEKVSVKFGKHLVRMISLLLTLLLLVFAYRYISNILKQVDLSGVTVNWPLVIGSAGVFAGAYGFLSWHWLLSTRVVISRMKKFQVLAFFASQPYKYMPTSLFTFSFRAVYAKRLGLGVKQSSLAQLVENASMLIANFAVFTLFFAARISIWHALTFALFLAALLLLFNKKDDLKLRFKKRSLTLRPIELTRMLAVASAGWVLLGLAFVLLNMSLGLDASLIDLIAANTIAFSLSILAFFAPGGIGVREIVYRAFSVSNLAIIYWRVLTFVCDFILGVTAILIIRYRYKNGSRLDS